MGLVIRTNNNWRPLACRESVPLEILDQEFDWCDDDGGFLQYKGQWYHLSQFERLPRGVLEDARTDRWDGVHGFGWSNGILIRLHEDGEQYRIAYFYCKGDE